MNTLSFSVFICSSLHFNGDQVVQKERLHVEVLQNCNEKGFHLGSWTGAILFLEKKQNN